MLQRYRRLCKFARMKNGRENKEVKGQRLAIYTRHDIIVVFCTVGSQSRIRLVLQQGHLTVVSALWSNTKYHTSSKLRTLLHSLMCSIIGVVAVFSPYRKFEAVDKPCKKYSEPLLQLYREPGSRHSGCSSQSSGS